MNNVTDFDTSRFYLGVLCGRKHDWNHTAKTLRRIRGKDCVVCKRIYSKAYAKDKRTQKLEPAALSQSKPRFWLNVEKRGETECWLWTGSKTKDGYGYFSVGCNLIRAHRASYIFKFGDIPPGLMVCHACDVRNCVNPSHLFVGTLQDNVDDMVKKGRSCRGIDSPIAKLDPTRVIEIRNIVSGVIKDSSLVFKTTGRLNLAAIARKYGIARTTLNCSDPQS